MSQLTVRMANPAGNITLFVLSEVPVKSRADIASRLMTMKKFGAEQVAFVVPPTADTDGRIEMMGGEFCGNALRAYGMLLAEKYSQEGMQTLLIESSGCNNPMRVRANYTANESYAQMPLPILVNRMTISGIRGTMVYLPGIAHFVTKDFPVPDTSAMDILEPEFRKLHVDAYGVIFLSNDRLTPLVKVPLAGSLVWEGSCGSGTLAALIAETLGAPNGEYMDTFTQPAGKLNVRIAIADGKITDAEIGGSVILSDPIEVEI